MEFIYPSLDLEHVNKCWADIPFVALPDGVHAFESDYVFMMSAALPSDPCATLYGVSCYQQVKADAKLKVSACPESATVWCSCLQNFLFFCAFV